MEILREGRDSGLDYSPFDIGTAIQGIQRCLSDQSAADVHDDSSSLLACLERRLGSRNPVHP